MKKGLKPIIFLLIFIIIFSFFAFNNEFNKYYIMSSTDMKTPYYISKSKNFNKTIFIIAGIHGNEISGIELSKNLLKKNFKNNRMIIIPEANIKACNKILRTSLDMRDLNRSFTDNINNQTEKLAFEISNLINEFNPDFIIDLHESGKDIESDFNAIGNSIIFYDIKKQFDIAVNINQETGFSILNNPPVGSLNQYISEKFGFNVITIETSKEDDLNTRIEKQLKIIDIVIEFIYSNF